MSFFVIIAMKLSILVLCLVFALSFGKFSLSLGFYIMHYFSSSQCTADALAVISFELLWTYPFLESILKVLMSWVALPQQIEYFVAQRKNLPYVKQECKQNILTECLQKNRTNHVKKFSQHNNQFRKIISGVNL